MPDVQVDPEKLRQFARTLTSSAQKLDELSRQMQRSLDATNWRDSERQKFEQDFRQTLKTLSQVAERLKSQQVPQLQRKAEALDRYHA